MQKEKLNKLLDDLPRSPGVYLMKDARENVIYVGKAKNLSNRVRSYFTPSSTDTRFFRRNIRRVVADIEIVLTATEKEALLLENNLIKLHLPRFNIRLRDDKDYLCLRLDRNQKWPKLEVVRRPKKDKAIYFGPYHSASLARETLKLARRHFKIRSCKDSQMANRMRPCLQHQIRRCLGPCVLDVDQTAYHCQVEYVRLFLLGRREELARELKGSMEEASLALEYEKAAVIRDQIKAIEETLAPQRVVTPGGIDQDILGLYRQGDHVEIVILEVRSGLLKGKRDFHFSGQEFPDEEILSSFIVQRYNAETGIPKEILVSRSLDDEIALSELLSDIRGNQVRLIHPKRGSRTSQTGMADLNARQLLESRLQEADAIEDRLTKIQQRLRLPRLPRRIECVDISHLGGGDTVGAISVVVDGKAVRSKGRTYKVRTASEGDDYGAMTEVLTRRFSRARKNEDGWEAPDLLIVDGGRGQLGVAKTVLGELELNDQPVVALAKERSSSSDPKRDRVFLPGRKNPIPLKARVSPLHMLAMARDEAHRLAVTYQRKLRKKKTTRSELDKIQGVGPKVKTALLKKIGSVKKIKKASLKELEAVSGIGPSLARKIKKGLGGSQTA